MRIRRVAVAVALAAAVVVPTVSTAASAAARPAVSAAHGKPGKPAKPTKAKFTASGIVTAVSVDTSTVVIAARGGTKDVRGQTITVTVPSTARIVVNGARRSLADVAAGYRITVTGTRSGTVYTAARLASKGARAHPKPTSTPTASPTVSPTPSDDDPTSEPTERPSPEASEDPSDD